VALLDGGATVPFVARYRKEITGALDDAQLRTLEERLNYLRELEERRTAILNSVREQGKLDAALEAAILTADSKGRLEDIYLPFKPKRRTKAEIAREAGLEPLSELLLTQPQNDPQVVAAGFVDAEKQVADPAAALDGARAILVERFAEDADLIGTLREQMWSNGVMASTVRTGKKTEGEKFKDYFDFREPLHKLPSHRILAMFRGEKEEILELQIHPDAQEPVAGIPSSYELKIMKRFAISDQGRPGDRWLAETARWAWRTKIQVHLNIDLRMRLWTLAETEAVRVFASNLRDLLLAAPAGARVTMGLDPGFRSGVKVAIVDATGRVVATTAIFPHEPQKRWDEALATLGKLAVQHRVNLIAIGNGTASRETDKLAAELAAGGRRAIVVQPQGARSDNSDREYLNWDTGENWPQAIAHDLVTCIDKRFRTIPNRDGRALIGLSAGGYGAFNIGLRNLDTFGAVESWSGYFAATNPAGTQVLNLGSAQANSSATVPSGTNVTRWLKRWPTLLAFYVGAQDTRFLTMNQQYDAALTKSGAAHTFHVFPGGHSGTLWHTQAPAWLGMALDALTHEARTRAVSGGASAG